MTQPNFKDMTGQRIGKLIVIERVQNDSCGRANRLCKCDCGNEIVVYGNYLRNNKITCCKECMKKASKNE